MISTFYKEYPEILIVTSLSLNSVPLIARLTVVKKQQPKQKHDRLAKKPIKEVQIRAGTAVPFVAPNVDVVLKSLSQKLTVTFNQHSVFFLVFFS